MTSSAGTRVPIPRLTTRSALVWFFGTLVVTLAIGVYVWVTQPENRWTAWVVLPLTFLLVLVLLTRKSRVGTSTGTVVWQRLWVWRTEVSLAALTSVGLTTDRGGSLHLGLKDAEHRATRFVPVLILTDYVQKSQSADFLTLLADQLDQWTPAHLRGNVPRQLRQQARHVADGGSPQTSPLASQVSHSLAGVAKGGGAVAGGSGLFS